MQTVRFYVLRRDRRERFACRIAEKAVAQGRRVHIRVRDEQAAQDMDTQLWIYHDQSFLPHSIGGNPSPHVKVTIHAEWLPEQRDVLINLGEGLPQELESFAQVVEVVGPDDATKALGRERFRQYRDRGLEPDHEIM